MLNPTLADADATPQPTVDAGREPGEPAERRFRIISGFAGLMKLPLRPGDELVDPNLTVRTFTCCPV
jgi:hypothetical protein